MLLVHRVEEGVEHFFPDERGKAALLSLLEGHGAHIVEHVDALDRLGDGIGDLRGDLAVIRAVYLVPVVLAGVVACGYVDADGASKVARGEGKRRRRLKARVHVRLDAVGCQHARCSVREQLGIDAGVVANGNGAGLAIAGLAVDEVGDTLGCLTHRMDVHAVGAGAQNAAQARRAEFQRAIERVLDCRFVTRFAHSLQVSLKFRVGNLFTPKVVQRTAIHEALPY